MVALTRVAACVLVALALGCAGAPPPSPPDDSADVVWGDEYAGLDEDADLADALMSPRAAAASASIDVLVEPAPAPGRDALRSLSAAARHGRGAVKYREGAAGRAGAAEVNDVGPLRHVVVGAIRPSVGEGALVADARDLGTPAVRAAPTAPMLRALPSSSKWGSVLGAGVTLGAGRVLASACAWRTHDDDSTWTSWGALEWRAARTRLSAAYGRSTARDAHAASLLAARAFGRAFASVEIARADARAAYAARVVSGDGWRALFAAGSPATPEVPVGDARRERRAAVLERRAAWRSLAGSLAVSSVARRDPSHAERRRRVDGSVRARLDDAARLEMGVRFTARASSQPPSPLEPGTLDARDEWRARVALTVRERPSPALELEHVFRLDAVRTRAAPGLAGTWRGTLQRGPIEGRIQAGAWSLKSGQLGYLGRGGLPGSGAFTTVSGSGSELTVVVRARVPGHASIGLEWRRASSGEEKVAAAAMLSW